MDAYAKNTFIQKITFSDFKINNSINDDSNKKLNENNFFPIRVFDWFMQ